MCQTVCSNSNLNLKKFVCQTAGSNSNSIQYYYLKKPCVKLRVSFSVPPPGPPLPCRDRGPRRGVSPGVLLERAVPGGGAGKPRSVPDQGGEVPGVPGDDGGSIGAGGGGGGGAGEVFDSLSIFGSNSTHFLFSSRRRDGRSLSPYSS